MRSKYLHLQLLGAFIFISSCSLFIEELPDCVKQERKPGPEIVHCIQPVYFGSPAWHPDGEWIAVEHTDSVDTNEDGLYDTLFDGIWLVHAQTGQSQPLLPFGNNPSWSPDGTHLAVDGAGIYTVEITSLQPAQFDTNSLTLLTDFDAPVFFPTWSGDGQWITFDTNYNHKNGAYLVWKIKKDGSDLTKVSINEYGGAREPDWSFSKDVITFNSYSSNKAEGPEIFTMDSDGSNQRQLTNNGDNYKPTFSPDGNKIAFLHRNNLKSHIVVMKANGTNKKKISNNWSIDPVWGPDGKQIVYIMSNQYYDRPGNGQLWIMNANGSNRKQLTHFNE